MVWFVDKPYITEKVRPRLSSIKWKTACGMGMTGIHFITLAENGTDLFDIYPPIEIKKRSYRKSNRVVIGIAHSRDAATELIEQMIKDCMGDTGLSDVRGYFEQFIKDHV